MQEDEWLNKWICDKKREAPCFAFTDSEERKTAYFILDNFIPKEEVKEEIEEVILNANFIGCCDITKRIIVSNLFKKLKIKLG